MVVRQPSAMASGTLNGLGYKYTGRSSRSDIAIDPGFVNSERDRAAARAARFAAEAKAPPPPLPVDRKTMWGQNTQKTDPLPKLMSLIERQEGGPTEAQLAALERMLSAKSSAPAPASKPPLPRRADDKGATKQQPAPVAPTARRPRHMRKIDAKRLAPIFLLTPWARHTSTLHNFCRAGRRRKVKAR